MKNLESRALAMALIHKDAAIRIARELYEFDINWVDNRNEKVFDQIKFLVQHKLPVDVLTVCERLKKVGLSVQVTPMYIAELTKSVASYNEQEMTEFINSAKSK